MDDKPFQAPLRHRRKYAPGDAVEERDLREALQLAAELTQSNEAYMPIYLRLERELIALQAKKSVMSRVAAAAEGRFTLSA